MHKRQSGFTMIELIIVIVILGILAAVALPRFIDLSGDAKAAALKGVAGAAGSAMTINYSGCAVNSNVVTAASGPTSKCQKVTNCTDVGTILQGGLPSGSNGYTVTPKALGTGASGSNGVEDTCTITQNAGGLTATFTGISAGNP